MKRSGERFIFINKKTTDLFTFQHTVEEMPVYFSLTNISYLEGALGCYSQASHILPTVIAMRTGKEHVLIASFISDAANEDSEVSFVFDAWT